MSAPLTLRRARPEEAGRLTEIAHAAKAHWGYPAAWLTAWRDDLTLTPAFLETHPAFVAERSGEAVGVLALSLALPEAEVEHLWVDPSAMGAGVGRRLFAQAVATAREAGATTLRILADPYAVAFYEHLGAIRVGAETYALLGEPRTLPVLRYAL